MHDTFLRMIGESILMNLLRLSRGSEIIFKNVQTEKQLLSLREIEVLLWYYVGKINLAIADIFYVSINTIKNHVHNAIYKLGVENRAQAATLPHKMDFLKWLKF